ncbi:MAG TPA: fibronectin type III domain-containing protein, partial [Streptosporangiaceae bacterium]|nr:fibronectin type III domain-containing protein [Streptosporangiaceae bacterium]
MAHDTLSTRSPRIVLAAAAALCLATGTAMPAAAADTPAAVTPATATNLLVNPGFETGTLAGWTCSATDSVTTNPVHSGSHALAGAASNSDDAQCSQAVSVQPNSAYTLSGWVEGNYVFIGEAVSGTQTWTSSASFQQLSTSFTTGASTTSVTVFVHGWYGQGTFYADDMSLTGPSGGGSPPPAPTGLKVTGTTSSSVSLSWTAPTGTVTGYNVYQGGSLATSATTTSATVTGLTASTTYTFTVTATNSAGESPHSSAVQATTQSGGGGGGGGSWRSPVYLMPLDNSPPSASQIASVISATGEKNFMLSFVLDSGGCTPAWDGNASQSVASDTAVAALVSAVRSAGGDAGVSFGGYNGTELGQSCGSASSLAAAYQAVISKYKLTHVDFDIENTALGDSGNELKRFQAIKMLENQDPGLTVSLTVPMTSIGFPGTGTDEIKQAITAGARIDVFNIEDFDYGLTCGCSQVSSDETVASDAASQLESLYGWPASTAWAHLG